VSVVPKPLRLILLILLAVATLVAGGCGGDNGGTSGASEQDRKVEQAFLAGMAHHHETAIEMARIAETRGEDPFIKTLAEEIVTTQAREVGQMKKIHERLFDGPLKPDPGAHDGLGLSAEEAGMTHTPRTNEILESANPFDRAFVDEMVPHHRGAIKMAKVVLASTRDASLKTLANSIVTTQETEVKAMDSFRTRKYGEAVPSTGGSGAPAGTEHEGH
jgi:uncharacterized protein (DUF305 family)